MTDKNKSILLIIVLSIIWGTSFILMKRALLVYTPMQIGAFRMFVSFLFMLPLIVRHFGRIEKSRWKYLAASGFLGNAIPSVLFPLAETRINSALAGMINSLTPIFTLIVGILFFNMKVARNRVFGLLIGLIGAVLLVTGQTGGVGIDQTNIFAMYVVLATVCYACSINILRNKLADIDSIRIAGFALMFAGIPMFVYLFSGDFIQRTQTVEGSGFGILCIVLLGLFGTAISTIMFNKLIKLSGSLAASSVTYLIPVVAVIWGLWDHEVFGIFHIVGMLAIFGGVYLVNRQSKRLIK